MTQANAVVAVEAAGPDDAAAVEVWVAVVSAAAWAAEMAAAE